MKKIIKTALITGTLLPLLSSASLTAMDIGSALSGFWTHFYTDCKELLKKEKKELLKGKKLVASKQLIESIKNDDIDGIQKAISNGADINYKSELIGNYNKYTPLYWATGKKNTKLVALLLSAGADPNIQNENQCTALHSSAAQNDSKSIGLLIRYGADPNAKNDQKITPLHKAAEKNNAEAIIALLNAGADPNSLGPALNLAHTAHETPLCRAADKNNIEAVKLLVEGGANLSINRSTNKTAAEPTYNTKIINYLEAAEKGYQFFIKNPLAQPTEEVISKAACMRRLYFDLLPNSDCKYSEFINSEVTGSDTYDNLISIHQSFINANKIDELQALLKENDMPKRFTLEQIKNLDRLGILYNADQINSLQVLHKKKQLGDIGSFKFK